MKQFTIKDFILYNNICFNCGKTTSLSFTIKDINSPTTISIKPFLYNKILELILQNTYSKGQLSLKIDCQSNKFITNSEMDLIKFLSNHHLNIENICTECCTSITSNIIDFNFKKTYIVPLTLKKEVLYIYDKEEVFIINSNFKENKSILVVDRTDMLSLLEPLTIHMKLMPLYKYRTKQNLLDKIKIYVTFS